MLLWLASVLALVWVIYLQRLLFARPGSSLRCNDFGSFWGSSGHAFDAARPVGHNADVHDQTLSRAISLTIGLGLILATSCDDAPIHVTVAVTHDRAR